LEPMEIRHRLLRDIGEHRIRAAKGDQRHLAEEYRDLTENIRRAEKPQQRSHRHKPKRQPDDGNPKRACDAGTRVFGQRIAEKAIDHGIWLAVAVTCLDEEVGSPPATDEADAQCAEHDKRKRYLQEK